MSLKYISDWLPDPGLLDSGISTIRRRGESGDYTQTLHDNRKKN